MMASYYETAESTFGVADVAQVPPFLGLRTLFVAGRDHRISLAVLPRFAAAPISILGPKLHIGVQRVRTLGSSREKGQCRLVLAACDRLGAMLQKLVTHSRVFQY
jgi:hypothetical protein